MVHPATRRAVRAALAALDTPLDIGFIFPGQPGEERGYGRWTNLDLSPAAVMAMLPRAAAANASGGNVYIRLGPGVRDRHPGIVMIDDLASSALVQLEKDGLEPCLTVETSPDNHQAWIRLVVAGTVPYSTAGVAARILAERYDGDPRAVSPRQPGRLPGFTNRKPRHQRQDGSFPFVRIVVANPGRVASRGGELLDRLAIAGGTAGGGARRTPKPLPMAAAPISDRIEDFEVLERVRAEQEDRLAGEVASGTRPAMAASKSELDFACVLAGLQAGIPDASIVAWLESRRPNKAKDYARRTVEKARQWSTGGARIPRPGDEPGPRSGSHVASMRPGR